MLGHRMNSVSDTLRKPAESRLRGRRDSERAFSAFGVGVRREFIRGESRWMAAIGGESRRIAMDGGES